MIVHIGFAVLGGADCDYLDILDEGTHKGVADSLSLESSETSE